MKLKAILSLTLGLVLALVAGGSVFYILQRVNQPQVQVAAAARDLYAGQALQAEDVRYVLIPADHPSLAALLTPEAVAPLVGRPVAHALVRGELLSTTDIASETNPTSLGRVALMMSDPSLVSIEIPIAEGAAPNAIVPGDIVHLSVSFNGTNYARPMDPNAPDQIGLYAGEAQAPDTLEALESVPTEAPDAGIQALELPVAKIVVQDALVLAVTREERQGSSPVRLAGSGASNTALAPAPRALGRLVSISVAVPADAIEVIGFALDNGIVRVAVLPLTADLAAPRQPTMGMSWDDFVAFMQMDREAAIRQPLPSVPGPGAARILADQLPDQTLAAEEDR